MLLTWACWLIGFVIAMVVVIILWYSLSPSAKSGFLINTVRDDVGGEVTNAVKHLEAMQERYLGGVVQTQLN